jgi:integrase
MIFVGTIVGTNFKDYKMKLTNSQIKNIKPQEKILKLTDGKGLNLTVHPNGSKYWRLNYRFGGKQKTLALGIYPFITLAQARVNAFKAKSLIAQGIDPSEVKKKEKEIAQGTNSFKNIAQLWFDTKKRKWSESHVKHVWKSLEDNIFKHLGNKSIGTIKSLDVTKALKVIEKRGSLEQLSKIRQRCNNIFIYAKAKDLIESNPVEGLEIILKEHTAKNFNHITIAELPDLLNDIKLLKGEPTTKAGLEIAIHTFLRSSEIRFLTWDDIKFDDKIFIIPKERMKMKRDHIVPMSKKVIQVLKDLQKITGQYKFVFASSNKPQEKPMSENAMLYALYRIGWKGRTTVHGFRHLASTTLRELGFKRQVVEKQLSHEIKNRVESAYNKAEYLEERTILMNEWSSFIENSNGKIIPIKSKLVSK